MNVAPPKPNVIIFLTTLALWVVFVFWMATPQNQTQQTEPAITDVIKLPDGYRLETNILGQWRFVTPDGHESAFTEQCRDDVVKAAIAFENIPPIQNCTIWYPTK